MIVMGEKNALYKSFCLRFSLINKQHVELLQKFEQESASGRKSRNQIIMDALADYYQKHEALKNDVGAEKPLSMEQLNKRLECLKNDIRVELYQEFMKLFAGNLMGVPNRVMMAVPTTQMIKQPEETVGNEEEELFDIEEDDVIMSNVQKWS